MVWFGVVLTRALARIVSEAIHSIFISGHMPQCRPQFAEDSEMHVIL